MLNELGAHPIAGVIGAGRWHEWNVADDADPGVRPARLACETSKQASPHEVGELVPAARTLTEELGGRMRPVKWFTYLCKINDFACLSLG